MREAIEANARGHECRDRGALEDALRSYARAAELEPDWAMPYFNAALIYKATRGWEACLETSQRARELDPEDEGSLWNIGIAATALEDWATARRAWTQYGIEIPDGDGALSMNLGLTPIRLQGEGEVIWCERIDPARAVILNVPFPSSGHRYRDVLLHDGCPNGARMLGEEEVPVFDMLDLLHASDFRTWRVTLRADEDRIDEHAAELEAQIDEQGRAEDWTQNTRVLCRACSEGLPADDESHDHSAQPESGLRNLGAALPDDVDAERIVREFVAGRAGLDVEVEACRMPGESLLRSRRG